MKRTVPLLITALSGIILLVSGFIPALQSAGEEVAVWFDILASIAFVLGGGNLLALHLQKISDRQTGWGYSAVTLFFFVVTLTVGLLKIGCPPEESSELFGQSTVPFAPAFLPEYRVAAQLPDDMLDARFPPSVRSQTRLDNGQLVFSGWMTPNQAQDLANFVDKQAWRCQVQQLFEQAQPPASLQNRLVYLADHHKLAFTGFMSEADRTALLALLPDSPETAHAVATLAALATRPTSHPLRSIPEGFRIPESARESLSLDGGQLTVRGPLTVSQREQMVRTWGNLPFARPLSTESRTRLLEEIESHGALNDRQRDALTAYFDAEWDAPQLVGALNTAGVVPERTRTDCELLQDLQSGHSSPALTEPAPPPVTLNADQQQLLELFVSNDTMSSEQLNTQMAALSPFTAAQQQALKAFLTHLPTQADQWRGLCFRLLEQGPLNSSQRDFLLAPARNEFQWRQSVGELFIASQQLKYPWSGNYSAQGSPFWWLYEYLFQPLLTTTFAVLAFYVASAAFRAFRAKNLEAVLLLGTAFIILLGRTSAGPALTNWLPESLAFLKLDNLTVSIMSIFNTAGNRAIMIGIALGTVATSLRILLGMDRSYLGTGHK